MDKPKRIHDYETPIMDSRRWNGFVPRKGDIVVATPIKSGTTWTQMMCALLVHQSPDLPLPLTKLSRWLDRVTQPVEDVLAEFEAQPYRRIIKTHTPLDGLPYFEEISYVFCGRDPRDAYLSMMDHLANISEESRLGAMQRAGMPADTPFPEAESFFPVWLTIADQPWMADGMLIGSILSLAESWWRFRHLPNLFFTHYADLTADLEGEMRRLAAFLGIEVSEERWPLLVSAANFAAMKARADEVAPGAHLGEWRRPHDFFRMARMGEWRERLSAKNQALYQQRYGERCDPLLKKWLENGRRGGVDPKALL